LEYGSLPNEVVNADTTILKNKLDKFWFHQPVKFDFNEELP